MAERYELQLAVHVSFDFPSEVDDIVNHFTSVLYADKHPNYWVNLVSFTGDIQAYDPITGEDL